MKLDETKVGQGDQQLPAVWMRSRAFRFIMGKLSIIEDWLNLISAFIIMFLMLIATAEISGRYIFNFPVPGHVEIVELVMAGMVFLGISYTERTGGHVRIGLLFEWVHKRRFSHIIESLCITLSLFVFLFILIYSFKAAIFSLKVGDTTPTLYWPTWPAKLTIPIGSFLLCIRFLVEIIQHVAQAITGIEIQFISQDRGNK